MQWIAAILTVVVGVLASRWIQREKPSADEMLAVILCSCGFAFLAGTVADISSHKAAKKLDFDRYCECLKDGSCRCFYPAPDDDPYQPLPEEEDSAPVYRGR